jgi:tyrosyl-DNA phosphodiesterase 2
VTVTGDHAGPLATQIMTRFNIIQARNLFRSSLLSPRINPTSIGRFTMPDTVVSIQSKRFSSGKWNYASQAPYDNNLPTSLSIITWNIDFAAPEAARRLTAALDYLRYHVFPEHKEGKPPHCLILLQEININAFDTLLAHPWVQEWFKVVPGSPEAGWRRGASYGTVTLVHAPLANSVCVHFEDSYMARNALVTDITVGGGAAEYPAPRILRVINTHLESLPLGTRTRISQMCVIGELLKEEGLLGGITCGDMNAIAPSDATLPEQNGLSDAWEENRREEEEEGTTWGYQPVTRFPPGRLDKILYTESDAFDVKEVRRIAVGLKMPAGEWVSDHYGLACHVGIRESR